MKFDSTIPITKQIGYDTGNTFHKFNEIGLQKAYDSPNNIYIEDDNMFIAGTKTWGDVFQDWIKLPLGLTNRTQRYQEAEKALQKNPQVHNLVGHSMGSSVALELEKRNPELYVQAAYGTPTVSSSRTNNRFKHPNDPVAAFDTSAITKSNKQGYNQHSFKNY